MHTVRNTYAGIRLWLVKTGLSITLSATALFVSAGRLDWVWGWVTIGVYLILVTMNALLLLARQPDLIAERSKVQDGAKKWDIPLALLTASVLPLATLIIAGLDARYNWSRPLPAGFRLAALIPMVLGFGFTTWAMLTNRFFSGTVRIQTDRGHAVQMGGPYRYVRHPGYVGVLAWHLGIPLLLGSWWAFIPSCLILAVIVLRTSLEDRTLQTELPGYNEYARQVRYRLLPGIW